MLTDCTETESYASQFWSCFKEAFSKKALSDLYYELTISKIINIHTVDTAIQNLFVNNKQITIHIKKKLSQNKQ